MVFPFLIPLAAASTAVSVPVVGCASDGQQGPLEAPARLPTGPRLKPKDAARLTLYVSQDGPAVLAPNGWQCIGLYGSNGSLLIVTPDAIPTERLFDSDAAGIAGPAVVAAYSIGGTSGRFAVIDAIARYFPSKRAFVDQSRADELVEASDIPSGPYPGDIIVSRSPTSIRLVTSAGKTGAGTASRLSPGPLSIDVLHTIVDEGDDPTLLSVWVRLPKDQRDLALPIFDDQPDR
ncbi:hypothetical protein [Sphingomonas jaspsi]|uniref:hypothetical protein n=1 Tax=Sphingomonas jaspsi TaxID=392409 RepID=UPI0004B88771|nr:hypothetical protein [Sphingomonas jaspsi]